MGKNIKTGLIIVVLAGGAYYGFKIAMAPKAAPVTVVTPMPGPAAVQPQAAEPSVQDSLGLAALAKGSLGTVKISENLVVPDSKLSEGCRLVKKMEPNAYFPATTNPFITETPELVDFVATAGFGTIPLIDVSQAVAVLYSDAAGHKTGVWGLQFKTASVTSNVLPLMHSTVVLKKEGLMLTFWHDNDAGSGCEQAIRDYLVGKGFESKLGGPR